MRQQFTNVRDLAILMIVWWILDSVFDMPKAWLREFGPKSLYYLSGDVWLSFFYTFTSALYAFLCAVLLGFVVGLIVGCMILTHSRAKLPFGGIGHVINLAMDWMYVVPVVLTIGLSYTLLVGWKTQTTLTSSVAGWTVVCVMLAVCGMTLGGYNVYKAVFGAVHDVSRMDRLFVDSLYFGIMPREHGLVRPFIRQAVKVVKLCDLRAKTFNEAIEKAFHLSIVAVIILETILPLFYEQLVPQSGVVHRSLSGIGWHVLKAQSSQDYRTLAGCIWAVLLFDMVMIFLLKLIMTALWLRYYSER
jgi:hypothetical protein